VKTKIALMLAPVEFGGVEKVCLTLLRNIDRHRFDVVAVLFTRPWERDNIFVQEIKKLLIDFIEIPIASKNKGDYFRIARCFLKTYFILKSLGPDIVHTNGYFADIVGILVSRFLGIPSISTCHGYIQNNWKYNLYNRIDYLALKISSRVIAVSEEIKAHLLNRSISYKNVLVIQNSVEVLDSFDHVRMKRKHILNKMNQQDQFFTIGYIGRLSDEKGVHYLLRACSKLNSLGLVFKAKIIGDGPRSNDLKQLSSVLGINKIVEFPGFQRNIQEWLSTIDVLVLPSITEGTPMILLEAMSWGTPVIASAVGGVPGIIENFFSGLLVPAGDPDKIVAAVNLLYSDENLRDKLAINAFNRVKKTFGSSGWISNIETIYGSFY